MRSAPNALAASGGERGHDAPQSEDEEQRHRDGHVGRLAPAEQLACERSHARVVGEGDEGEDRTDPEVGGIDVRLEGAGEVAETEVLASVDAVIAQGPFPARSPSREPRRECRTSPGRWRTRPGVGTSAASARGSAHRLCSDPARPRANHSAISTMASTAAYPVVLRLRLVSSTRTPHVTTRRHEGRSDDAHQCEEAGAGEGDDSRPRPRCRRREWTPGRRERNRPGWSRGALRTTPPLTIRAAHRHEAAPVAARATRR